jgi:hypothetical protein
VNAVAVATLTSTIGLMSSVAAPHTMWIKI